MAALVAVTLFSEITIKMCRLFDLFLIAGELRDAGNNWDIIRKFIRHPERSCHPFLFGTDQTLENIM